ncbi:MAG TPA: lipoprotein [Hyphomicrobiales bacterium]|nr:lipoprotein [Kaistiaceae bacterium]HQF30448.1 lipoprotein [Hyphomicrobiales bacterium]
MHRTTKRTAALIALLAVALAVSACGRRGALEAPPGKEIYNPGTPDKRLSTEKPEKPFVLDPLL